VKGRANEATGVLTGDKDLEREGKKVDDAVDAVKKKLDEWLLMRVRTCRPARDPRSRACDIRGCLTPRWWG